MNDEQKRGLTAEPGTVEFYQQLLAVAQGSDHPMDRALARVLEQQIAELEESGDGA